MVFFLLADCGSAGSVDRANGIWKVVRCRSVHNQFAARGVTQAVNERSDYAASQHDLRAVATHGFAAVVLDSLVC